MTLKDIGVWGEVTDDTWVDFAKTYLAQMKAGFTAEAIAKHTEGEKIRLYFDYRYGEDYERELSRRYIKTPLLGVSQYPQKDVDYLADGLNHAIAPLRKHLLVADDQSGTDFRSDVD